MYFRNAPPKYRTNYLQNAERNSAKIPNKMPQKCRITCIYQKKVVPFGGPIAYKRNDGVYIIPLSALKP